MGYVFELSISEENKKVVRIIEHLKRDRYNVSDKLCKYVIDGYETEILHIRLNEDMKRKEKIEKEQRKLIIEND